MKTILVIDDKDDVRAVIVTTLAQHGFATIESDDGSQGVQLAINEQPDLILCDVKIPVMDGYQILAAVRQTPAIAAVPFILMTGSVGHEEFRRGMVCGADDFLLKPFAPDELVEAVVSRLVRRTEFEWQVYHQAEKLRDDAVSEFSRELAGPINGILGAVSCLLREPAAVQPDKLCASAHVINESALRLNQLTRTWAH